MPPSRSGTIVEGKLREVTAVHVHRMAVAPIIGASLLLGTQLVDTGRHAGHAAGGKLTAAPANVDAGPPLVTLRARVAGVRTGGHRAALNTYRIALRSADAGATPTPIPITESEAGLAQRGLRRCGTDSPYEAGHVIRGSLAGVSRGAGGAVRAHASASYTASADAGRQNPHHSGPARWRRV